MINIIDCVDFNCNKNWVRNESCVELRSVLLAQYVGIMIKGYITIVHCEDWISLGQPGKHTP